MWQEVEAVVPDITVLRKLLFASVYIPKNTPQYLEEIVAFAFNGRVEKPDCDKIRVLLENIQELDETAFRTDTELTSDLDLGSHPSVQSGVPLGVILISTNNTCKSCGGKLLVRSDRPSSMSLYTDNMGTVPATHYRKYCQNYCKGCTFTQHYSYHSTSDDDGAVLVYDSNWADLPYFVSTSKTAFSTAFLERFDAEILIGQVSYKQKSDIHNYYKYETVTKQSRYPATKKTTHVANSMDADKAEVN